jgi:predicted double-glycine peptidase
LSARATLGGGALVLLLAGCSSVSTFRGIPLSEAGGVYVGGVPVVRQDDRYACGPASLAAVAAYWGVDFARFRAADALIARGEASGAQLQTCAEALGLRAFVFRGSAEDAEKNLRRGRPLIVMIPRPADPHSPGGLIGEVAHAISEHLPRSAHWVVLTGFADNGDAVIQDPASGPLRIRRAKFLADWASLDNACVLVVAR